MNPVIVQAVVEAVKVYSQAEDTELWDVKFEQTVRSAMSMRRKVIPIPSSTAVSWFDQYTLVIAVDVTKHMRPELNSLDLVRLGYTELQNLILEQPWIEEA